MAKISTLVDTFSSTLNGSLWSGTNGVDTNAGHARLPILAAGCSMDSVASYDLTSSQAFAQVTPAGPGNGSIQTGMQIGPDGNCVEIRLAAGGTSLVCGLITAFSHSNATITYNATSMAWWQIRESGGTLFWETSPDGTTWTTQRSATYTISLTSVVLEFWAFFSATETAGQFSFVDNVNSGGGGGGGGGGGAAATLLWSDEFNGPAGTDVSSVDWDTIVGAGSASAGRLEYDTAGTANKALDGLSNLVITARREAVNGRSFSSARIEGKHPFTTGYVEFRAKMPVWPGLMPTTWLYGALASTFPTSGSYSAANNFAEIDMPVVVTGGGAADPTSARLSVDGDFASDQTGAKIWQLGGTANKFSTAPARVGDAWHTFGVFIDPADHSVTFWVDGVLFHRYTQADALALGGTAGSAARLAAGVHADNNVYSSGNSIANAERSGASFAGFTSTNREAWFMIETGGTSSQASGNVEDMTGGLPGSDPAGNFMDGRYKPRLCLTLYGSYPGVTAAQIAAGAADPDYLNICTWLNDINFPQVSIRWGWECDGGWWAIAGHTDWGSIPADYIAGFRHVHDYMNAHLNNRPLWEWNAFSNQSYRGSDPAGYKVNGTGGVSTHNTYDLYPGDAYVDIIGADNYEYGPGPENGILGPLQAAAAFAKNGLAGISAGGKQVGFSEYGFWDPIGSSLLTNESNGRTVRVMNKVLAFFDTLPAPGQPGGLAYHMYFDGNPGTGSFAWQFYPQALAVYKQRMLTTSGSGTVADQLWPYGTNPLIPVIEVEVGSLSGTPDNSTNSDTLMVDWVRYYDKPPGIGPGSQALTIASAPNGGVAPAAVTLTQTALGSRQSTTASAFLSGGVAPGSATLASIQRLFTLNFIDGGVAPQGSQHLGQLVPIRELVASTAGSLVTASIVFDATSGHAVHLIAGNETPRTMQIVGRHKDGTELVRVGIVPISITQEVYTFADGDIDVTSEAFNEMTWSFA